MRLPPRDRMYRAVQERDSSFRGVFFVAVRTTGIFCVPGCTARMPLEKNVEFFATAKEAVLAGFRPCRAPFGSYGAPFGSYGVCRPLAQQDERPDWVAQLLEAVERSPSERLTDGQLKRMGIAPERARRWFKSRFGMTFQGYHRARRLGLALQRLREGGDAVDAAWEGGYQSDSGFRDAFERVLGAPPSRASGVRALQGAWMETPLGPMLAVAGEAGLCLLEFLDRRMLPTQIESVRQRFGCGIVPGQNAAFETLNRELEAYFRGELRQFSTPLDLRGAPFQERVWRRLLDVPYGETVSYGQLAQEIGAPNSQRAVGRANGDNRLAILVPCHRVIRSDGTLCGYGGGLWRKKRLLELEQGTVPLL
jgi:AraC family transcriptional regulator, regulatory protein of adaptative response / methylated-DNA-[protein]-cysteine methyltransferase